MYEISTRQKGYSAILAKMTFQKSSGKGEVNNRKNFTCGMYILLIIFHTLAGRICWEPRMSIHSWSQIDIDIEL